MTSSPPITVGVLLYNSEQAPIDGYIKPFFDSLLRQKGVEVRVIVLDNHSPRNAHLSVIRSRYPSIHVTEGTENIGFARGHNRLIRQTAAPFYLLLNCDMFLEDDYIVRLYNLIQEKSNAAAVSGKILKWDYKKCIQLQGNEKGKTDIIDSLGIGITPCHKFFDIGQGKRDAKTDDVREVFGLSGVSMLLRRTALETIHFQDEYFDEAMFMYKEDIDLCYRLRWAGYQIYRDSSAIAYHDRTVSNDSTKNEQVRYWSYLHEKMLVVKNIDKQYPFYIRCCTAMRQWVKKVYGWMFDRVLLRAENDFKRLRPLLRQKRQEMMRQGNGDTICSFMHYVWN